MPQPPTERSPGIPRLLIVGDSVAHGFAVGLYRNSTHPGIELVDGSAPSCGTLRVGTYTIFTEWIAAREACNAWEQSLDRFAPDAVLILRSLPDLTDRRIDGQQISIQDQEYQRRWKEQMDADIERIASRGARPVIAIPPRLSPDYAEGAIDDRHDLLFVMLRAVAEAHDLPVIDLDTLARELGLNRRFDNVHLSERDEVTLAEAALPAIKEVLPST